MDFTGNQLIAKNGKIQTSCPLQEANQILAKNGNIWHQQWQNFKSKSHKVIKLWPKLAILIFGRAVPYRGNE